MKKRKLQIWSSAGKKLTVKYADKIVKFVEYRALFPRMLLLSKSRDISQVVRSYELSDIQVSEIDPKSDTRADSICKCVAVVDGMADLKTLNKPEGISNIIAKQWQRYSEYDEVHLVFYRYDIGESLKTSTRERRLGGIKAVVYHITDTTSTAKISKHNLLAHIQTKDELTAYLVHTVLVHDMTNGNKIVVALDDHTEATHRKVYLSSSREEADTKLILHSLDTTPKGLPQLGSIIRILTFNARGPSKAAALTGFHALSGANIIGRFAGKGKMTCWKVLQNFTQVMI